MYSWRAKNNELNRHTYWFIYPEAVSLVPSHMKSYENKKKSIWFDGFLMTCYLWKILLVFIWLTHFLMTSYGFYSYWNRKNLPVFYMTSQVICLFECKKKRKSSKNFTSKDSSRHNIIWLHMALLLMTLKPYAFKVYESYSNMTWDQRYCLCIE